MATRKRTYVDVDDALDVQLEVFFGEVYNTLSASLKSLNWFCICYRRKTGFLFHRVLGQQVLDYLVRPSELANARRLRDYWLTVVTMWKDCSPMFDEIHSNFYDSIPRFLEFPHERNALFLTKTSDQLFDGMLRTFPSLSYTFDDFDRYYHLRRQYMTCTSYGFYTGKHLSFSHGEPYSGLYYSVELMYCKKHGKFSGTFSMPTCSVLDARPKSFKLPCSDCSSNKRKRVMIHSSSMIQRK
jgi:hypothetical protein